MLLAEFLDPARDALRPAIRERHDAAEIARCAVVAGMKPCLARAVEAVAAGLTSPAEVHRVFGPAADATNTATMGEAAETR
jgi:type II secretory ATPase GspE/PulE/Tfp pilus assembly ATPase PilB-like protein